MNRTVAIVLALWMMGAAPAMSAPVSGPAALADSFFRALETKDALSAYNGLWAGTMMSKKQAEVENLATQTDAALKVFGKPADWELLAENKIGENFYENTYLLRGDQGPLFFKIQFYKAPTRWIATNVYFTDTYKNIAP